MTMPFILPSQPLKRPGFITDAAWNGQPGNDRLQLSLYYYDDLGVQQAVNLFTMKYTSSPATLCLPTAAGIADVPDDVLTAHLRMAGMIAGVVPGSAEYEDAMVVSGATNASKFQTPCGAAEVTAITYVTDRTLRITWKKNGAAPTKNVDCDVTELAVYDFVPSTQLLVVAGAIKKTYSTYIQDPDNGKFLTQAQMDTIVTYVKGLVLWV